jgi:hypothetical protein
MLMLSRATLGAGKKLTLTDGKATAFLYTGRLNSMRINRLYQDTGLNLNVHHSVTIFLSAPYLITPALAIPGAYPTER